MKPIKKYIIYTVSVLIIIILFIVFIFKNLTGTQDQNEAQIAQLLQSISNLPFVYTFNVSGSLEESENMNKSTSAYWWLDSGGRMLIQNNIGKTLNGPLENDDKWRKLYAKTNPQDTDNGYYPQNIFRLIFRGTTSDLTEEAYFYLYKYNTSPSQNRGESNGILLFMRYNDANDLYYAGLRVDGTVVIKKKMNGTYFTLAQKQIISGIYDRQYNPNLIPLKTWIGIKSLIKNNPDGSVNIKLYIDFDKKNIWDLVLQVNDNGITFGPIVKGPGYSGIRTDFMDVAFSSFKIGKI